MNYKIELMKDEELKETLDLVKIVFDEFVKPDYSEEGVLTFYKFASFENIKNGLNENLEIYVAKADIKIVGMICTRDKNHISMLFVDKNYHHQGIAKNLVDIIKPNIKNNYLTVNSAPYAIEFYHKIGFINQSELQEVDGIKFLPMKMDLTKTFEKNL